MSDQAPAAFPLRWPPGVPRRLRHQRKDAQFSHHKQRMTVATALERLQQQLDLLGGKLPVVSSNIELRLDGRPRSGQSEPDDPGVCLYFQLRGRATAMPCDAFTRVADNITGIAMHIDAARRIERYGVGTIEQMFTGFQAIRSPGPKPWREVLGIKADADVTPDLVRERRRVLAAAAHPDAGGSEERMAEINAAADQALQELRR